MPKDGVSSAAAREANQTSASNLSPAAGELLLSRSVNNHVRARIPAIACAVALAAWCFFVFHGAWIDLARADHSALLEERLFFDTRAAYAWHLLGYQRTRIMSGEDLVLSRPLFDAWHAVLEGLLEVGGLERGLLGIAVHALTVIAVFRFALRWLPIGLALLAGLAIASPLAGIDLVVWRHATPYGLAVCFLAFSKSFSACWIGRVNGSSSGWSRSRWPWNRSGLCAASRPL